MTKSIGLITSSIQEKIWNTERMHRIRSNSNKSILLLFSLLLSYHATITSAFAASIDTGSSYPTIATKPAFTRTTSSTTINTASTSTTLNMNNDNNNDNESKKLRTVLVTGGCGYIGSHTCLELLLTKQYRVVVIDNLDNSSTQSLKRVIDLVSPSNLTPEEAKNRLHFRNVDIRDSDGIDSVLNEFPEITSCIHFAGLKAVGESVSLPLNYYQTNIGGTCTLLQRLKERKIQHFVFSSSATVYGEPEILPLPETARLSATNPYGRTKLFIEEILRDTYAANPELWNIMILRYFNPIGAHPSGKIGEDPRGIPNNLMPFVAQVCVGRRDKLSIFGNDYNTPDGTGVRDYIHVVDLAKGHVAALQKLYATGDTSPSCKAINLGTGTGISVLDIVDGMSKATGKPVPYVIAPRRPGDVASVYADPKLAADELGWKASLDLTDMCEDTWRWQSLNPYGYESQEKLKEETIV